MSNTAIFLSAVITPSLSSNAMAGTSSFGVSISATKPKTSDSNIQVITSNVTLDLLGPPFVCPTLISFKYNFLPTNLNVPKSESYLDCFVLLPFS